MVERKDSSEAESPQAEKVRGTREGVKEVLSEAEVMKNFDEGEFGQYYLAQYGVESFAEVASDEDMAMAFLQGLTFTEEDNPEGSLLDHLEEAEIRLFLTMVASEQPEDFLVAISDPDFPGISQEVLQEAVLVAKEAIK